MAAICSVGCRKAQIRLVCTIAHHFRIGSGCKKKGSVLVRLGCQYSSSKSRELAHWTSDDPRPAWSFWSGSMKRWRWKMIWQDPQRRAMSQIGVMRWEINAIIKKLESHCECVQDEVAWEWQLGVDQYWLALWTESSSCMPDTRSMRCLSLIHNTCRHRPVKVQKIRLSRRTKWNSRLHTCF